MNHVVIHTQDSREKSGFYSVLTTLAAIVVLGLLGYGVWFLITKVIAILGVVYLVVIAILEFRNLIATRKYTVNDESLDKAMNKMVEGASKPDEDGSPVLTETQAKGLTYVVVIAVVFGVFMHLVVSTLVVYGFGKTHPGHAVALLGLSLTLWYALRTIVYVKQVFYTLKHHAEVGKTEGKFKFRLSTYVSKTRSLLALVFIGSLLAANYGFYLWF